MTEEVDYLLIGTVIVAFVVGYVFVSFIVGKMRGSKTDDRTGSQKTADSDSWEAHRQQQEEYHREQERLRREAEAERAKEDQRKREEQRQRAEEEEARRRASSGRSSTAKTEAYYGRILGLQGRVSWSDVRSRYRELVVQYHPDKVNHLGPKLRAVAEQEMKEINEAFDYFKRLYG